MVDKAVSEELLLSETSPFLRQVENRLCLCLDSDKGVPVCVDFLSPEMDYRLRTSGKKQGLARAVGLHRHKPSSVLDCTAGLGKDAFILAALGCDVTLLEHSPQVHALLQDGLRRAELSSVQTIVARMQLHHASAYDWLRDIQAGKQQAVDVIYLDPMFPVRKKAARVKKDMAALQQFLGPDDNVPALLALARQTALKRVVLKRPAGQLAVDLPEPDFLVKGKANQFAVYLTTP